MREGNREVAPRTPAYIDTEISRCYAGGRHAAVALRGTENLGSGSTVRAVYTHRTR